MIRDPINIRSSGHDITKFKWIVEFPASHQPTDVSNVGHKESIMLISDGSKFTVVPVPRVRRTTAQEYSGFEEAGLRSQKLVVDQTRFLVDSIWEGLEIYGRSCYLPFSRLGVDLEHSVART